MVTSRSRWRCRSERGWRFFTRRFHDSPGMRSTIFLDGDVVMRGRWGELSGAGFPAGTDQEFFNR